jgi:hypothetical protein
LKNQWKSLKEGPNFYKSKESVDLPATKSLRI